MSNNSPIDTSVLPGLLVALPKRSDLRVLPVRTTNGAVVEGLDVARNIQGLCIRIGRALAAMREQSGVSLEQMASHLRTSIVSVRRIEDGNLRLSDAAAWEELCDDEIACCPRSLVQDEALVKELTPPKDPETALAVRASSAIAVRSYTAEDDERRIENDRLVARLEQRAKTEARLLTEVADLRAEIASLQAKNKQYREWLHQLGYKAP
jgi:predicted transcriptional regulator